MSSLRLKNCLNILILLFAIEFELKKPVWKCLYGYLMSAQPAYASEPRVGHLVYVWLTLVSSFYSTSHSVHTWRFFFKVTQCAVLNLAIFILNLLECNIVRNEKLNFSINKFKPNLWTGKKACYTTYALHLLLQWFCLVCLYDKYCFFLIEYLFWKFLFLYFQFY